MPNVSVFPNTMPSTKDLAQSAKEGGVVGYPGMVRNNVRNVWGRMTIKLLPNPEVFEAAASGGDRREEGGTLSHGKASFDGHSFVRNAGSGADRWERGRRRHGDDGIRLAVAFGHERFASA